MTRILVGGVILCVSLTATGASYEALTARQDAVHYPPAGWLVDVGGFNLHITCVGRGSPTVVFEAGAGEVGSLAWGTAWLRLS